MTTFKLKPHASSFMLKSIKNAFLKIAMQKSNDWFFPYTRYLKPKPYSLPVYSLLTFLDMLTACNQ